MTTSVAKEERRNDDIGSISSVESEWTIECEECGEKEHEQEDNGQLLYGCIGVPLCSKCYPSAKAELIEQGNYGDDGTYANGDDEESPDGNDEQTTLKNDKPQRRKVRCGECGVEGHNKRTCSKAKERKIIESRYTGETDENGLPHGKGIMNGEDGLPIYDGNWEHGKRHGMGKEWARDEDGSKYVSYNHEWVNDWKRWKLCINNDCERYPPDWDPESDTESTYQEGQWKKCCLCDGYFDDDGLEDILYVEEEPNNQEDVACNLCGGHNGGVVQMKGSGQYLCGNACDESSDESSNDDNNDDDDGE